MMQFSSTNDTSGALGTSRAGLSVEVTMIRSRKNRKAPVVPGKVGWEGATQELEYLLNDGPFHTFLTL